MARHPQRVRRHIIAPPSFENRTHQQKVEVVVTKTLYFPAGL
jgi:hypothetical protein